MKHEKYMELVEAAKAGTLTDEQREQLEAEADKRVRAAFAAQAPKKTKK